MIELPFGNGVTAALIFVVFELILIPILMESTTKAAAFFVYKQINKGNHVRVSTASYPLWSEGLFSRQRSHVLIFLIRMMCIVVPVYLETRLQFVQRPVKVTKQLPNSFVIKSKVGESLEENWEDSFDDFLEVVDTCSYINENGWLIAATVNVTYARDEGDLNEGHHLDRMLCIPGTAKSTFRIEEVHSQDSRLAGGPDQRDRNDSLRFPARLQYKLYSSKKPIVKLFVNNAKDIECFMTVPTHWIYIDGLGHWNLLCHKLEDTWIEYFYAKLQVIYRPPEFVTSKSATAFVNSENRTLFIALPTKSNFVLRFMARLEFKERVLLGAEYLVRDERLFFQSDAEMHRQLGGFLYSRAQNVSVRMPGDVHIQYTVLDDQTLIIGAIEIGFIFASGIVMKLLFLWKNIPAPNTLNGLSQNFARVISQPSQMAEKDRINLSLTSEFCKSSNCEIYMPTN